MKTIAAFIFSWVIIALVLATLPVDAAPSAVLKRERLTVTTAGATGSASGSRATSAIIQGEIVRIDVDYGSLTTTTDITIAQTNELVSNPIVVKANNITDTTFFPTIILTDNSGTARTYDGTRPVVSRYYAADQVTVTLGQSTAATPAVTVDIYYEE